MKRLIVFVSLLVLMQCSAQQYSKFWKDVDYAADTMKYHLLDIYLPAVEKPSYPVVVVIYGSAWFGNNLKGMDLKTIGRALLDSGIAVVMPNHRSSMDAKYPAQINDIKAVVRYIRANAGKYQLDTSFIGITGSSSGGHLAALAGTSGFVRQYNVGSATADIEGTLGSDTAYSSAVDAVVDWFGPTNLLVMDSCRSSKNRLGPHPPEESLIGGPLQGNEDKYRLADPIIYVDSHDPPFLILHGDADPLVPPCESMMLFEALQKAGVSSQLVMVPGAGHGNGMFVEKYLVMMADFFKSKMKADKN